MTAGYSGVMRKSSVVGDIDGVIAAFFSAFDNR
jgi:hypothetical protein